MSLSFFDLFCLITVFQLSVFIVFLIHKGRNRISNIFLTIFFLSQAISLVNSVISAHYTYVFNNYWYLINIGLAFKLLWGPSYFFYIKTLIEPNYKINYKVYLHSIPFVISWIFLLLNFQFNSKAGIKQIVDSEHFMLQVIHYTLVAQLITYNILAILSMYVNKKQLQKRKLFLWLKFIVFGYLLGCFYNITASLLNSLFVGVSISFFLSTGHFYFFVFFNIIFYKALIKPETFGSVVIEKAKYMQTGLSQNQVEELYKVLIEYMDKNKPFLIAGLALSDLAGMLNMSSRHLSQVINVCEESNFSDFINKQRLLYAKTILTDPLQKDKTILEILFEVGFNSKTSFNIAFKKFTGLTPLQYRNKHME